MRLSVCSGAALDKRTFLKLFKEGSPNLLVTSPGMPEKYCIIAVCNWYQYFAENVLCTALSLYMEDETLPLPTLDEVLVCNTNTTAEEVYRILSTSLHYHYVSLLSLLVFCVFLPKMQSHAISNQFLC